VQVGKLIRDEDSFTSKEGANRGEYGMGWSDAVRFEEEPICQCHKLKHAKEKDDRFDDLAQIVGESGEESVHAISSLVRCLSLTTQRPM
jgi:hypothetical protein